MGIKQWWTQLTSGGRRDGGRHDGQPARERTRAEQETDREERRLGGMSAEDRAWEQASLQRHRAQEVQTHAAQETANR